MDTDPKAVAEAIRDAFISGDMEEGHMQADRILCDLLESLGYAEAVAIFRTAPKWYA